MWFGGKFFDTYLTFCFLRYKLAAGSKVQGGEASAVIALRRELISSHLDGSGAWPHLCLILFF
jgi:hypothetical protein